MHAISVNYGYNIKVTNNEMEALNRHMISLKIYIATKTKVLQTYDDKGEKVISNNE